MTTQEGLCEFRLMQRGCVLCDYMPGDVSIAVFKFLPVSSLQKRLQSALGLPSPGSHDSVTSLATKCVLAEVEMAMMISGSAAAEAAAEAETVASSGCGLAGAGCLPKASLYGGFNKQGSPHGPQMLFQLRVFQQGTSNFCKSPICPHVCVSRKITHRAQNQYLGCCLVCSSMPYICDSVA